MEAGPVVFPAYPQTSVGVRSMTDDQRKRAIEDLTAGFEAADDEPTAERTLEEVIAEYGFTPEELLEAAERGENPFAAKKKDDADKGKSGDGDKSCSCDKMKGDHKVSDHPKKTSSDKSGSAAKTEKKSEDDTSDAPEAGSDAVEPRSEDQDEAAQAGTSTGMSKNARERALRLLDI